MSPGQRAMIRHNVLTRAVVLTLLATGCTRPTSRGDVGDTLSIVARADPYGPDGLEWDPGGEMNPVFGRLFVAMPVIRLSPNPDLVLTVFAENGDVTDYLADTTRLGMPLSECENRLTCRWDFAVPAGYYALVVSDLDVGPNLTQETLGRVRFDSTTPVAELTKLLGVRRQFVAAQIFSDEPAIDHARAESLEVRVRAWLAAQRTEFLPRLAFSAQAWYGCQQESCEGDAEVNFASLSVIPVR
jgi:hypothetical protein